MALMKLQFMIRILMESSKYFFSCHLKKKKWIRRRAQKDDWWRMVVLWAIFWKCLNRKKAYKFEFTHPCFSQLTVPKSNVFYMTFRCHACFMHCLCVNADTYTSFYSKLIRRANKGPEKGYPKLSNELSL